MCSSRKTRLICGITVPALSVCLLAGCVKDEESPETQEEPSRDVTELFDPDFARVLESKGYIKDADNITTGEVSAITEVDVSSSELESLRGIEYFTALTNLPCHYNNITSLDVSNNTALTYLNCDDNQLTSLDVSKSTALTELLCQRNLLTGLDITNNTALTSLPCSGNPGKSGKFTVTAWFGNDAVPEDFTTGTWSYNGQTVEIEYVKAE